MYKTKLNKIWNLIDKIKNDINLSIISDFLEWFYEKIILNFNKKEPKNIFKKWDIYFINLWKNIWSELNKNRPCIIYSWLKYNKWNTVIILPLKSYKWKTNYLFNIFIKATKENNLKLDSIIDLSSIRQISKKRIKLKRWILEEKYLKEIDKKVLKLFQIKKLEN